MTTTKALPTLAATGLAALALTACGGGDAGAGTTASPRDRAQEGALRFARCMRASGVDLPDPEVGDNGMVRIGPGPGQAPAGSSTPGDPAFRRAERRCRRHLQAGGGAPDPQQLAEHRDAFVAYARCMRAEGVDMPDPGEHGLLVGPGQGTDPEAPAFKRADAVCHRHLAAVDRDLGIGR